MPELLLPDTVLPEPEVELLPDVEPLSVVEPDVELVPESELLPDVELLPEPEVELLEPDPDEDLAELEAWAACSAKKPRLKALTPATMPVTSLMRELSRLLFMVQPSPPRFSASYEKPFDFL